MTADPLDAVLEKLAAGDAEAEQAFRDYEPYLRMVVRRQLSPDLRAKFDSLDVVQSVWVHLLKGFRRAGYRFTDANHLRAFLTRLMRNRFIDRLRRHRGALDNERRLDDDVDDVAANDPQPDDVAVAHELWAQLLDLCPPAHREVLRLKRDGALTGEIAVRTGLHEGSVRRILHTLSLRLARRREDDRREP